MRETGLYYRAGFDHYGNIWHALVNKSITLCGTTTFQTLSPLTASYFTIQPDHTARFHILTRGPNGYRWTSEATTEGEWTMCPNCLSMLIVERELRRSNRYRIEGTLADMNKLPDPSGVPPR